MSRSNPENEQIRIRNLDLETCNRRLVIDFYYTLFCMYDLSSIDRFVAADYIHHEPGFSSGREAMIRYFDHLCATFPKMRFSIKHAASDGDLVFLHSFMQLADNDAEKEVVDIFRVTNNKITERWKITQDLPLVSWDKRNI